MCQYGEVEGCIVDGPFALDNAIDVASTREKGIKSPVAGRADILVVPNLELGNIFGKALQYYAGKTLVHVAVGAKVPILIDSRTAVAAGKLRSLAMASLMCGGYICGTGRSVTARDFVIRQISVFLENLSGSLAALTRPSRRPRPSSWTRRPSRTSKLSSGS